MGEIIASKHLVYLLKHFAKQGNQFWLLYYVIGLYFGLFSPKNKNRL